MLVNRVRVAASFVRQVSHEKKNWVINHNAGIDPVTV